MTALSDTPSLKERQRQEREQLILRAAGELLMERGYHDMSLDDIASRVGIAKGTIYLHFARKEDLVIVMIEKGADWFVKAFEDALDSATTPRDKLMAVIHHFASNTSTPGFRAFSAMLQNPEIHCRMAERHEEMRMKWDAPLRRVAAAVDEGKATGEFDPSLPTPVIVRVLMSLLSPREHGPLMEQAQLTEEQVTAYLTQFFFKGIAAQPHDCPTDDKQEDRQ
ncbi:MAG TPA: TetR/AcrR family transcriptional regulator [Ktedonobacterales bacterium]|nr:TetR/AcrR family transcriptional regulator [Ktedonobacterales bacterium]